jgi:tRNA(Met) C34 N-acetyltransferase TmcA
MDGVTGYTVLHKKDEKEYWSGCYSMSIMNGLSMRRSEMQELADKMNNK